VTLRGRRARSDISGPWRATIPLTAHPMSRSSSGAGVLEDEKPMGSVRGLLCQPNRRARRAARSHQTRRVRWSNCRTKPDELLFGKAELRYARMAKAGSGSIHQEAYVSVLERNAEPLSRAMREDPLAPERVAYWYFRLNGFLQIENFVVHPSSRGSQRTDADLLAVRFPHRKEFLFDDDEPIEDDEVGLGLSLDRIDVVIAEIKANQKCTLNGPWTRSDRQNVQRILAAEGVCQRIRFRKPLRPFTKRASSVRSDSKYA
jgi:hypothetical protein